MAFHPRLHDIDLRREQQALQRRARPGYHPDYKTVPLAEIDYRRARQGFEKIERGQPVERGVAVLERNKARVAPPRAFHA